jgi:hypothetical protein
VPRCDSQRAHCFGIRIHLGTQDGKPYVTTAWITEQFAFANQMFTPIDVGFELAEVDLVTPPAIIDGRAARDAIVKKVKASTAIDVFVVGALADLDDKAFPLFGVHWRPAKQLGRHFVILSSYAWTRTMAHELGHFFGLPHSTYAISIMNKAPRLDPPLDQRRFADQELPIMKRALKKIIASKELKQRKQP